MYGAVQKYYLLFSFSLILGMVIFGNEFETK